jgi:hypothetical protein
MLNGSHIYAGLRLTLQRLEDTYSSMEYWSNQQMSAVSSPCPTLDV